MWMIIVSSLIIILDQITKWVVSNKFQYGESVEIIKGFFNLTLVHNPGAAFGLFANQHLLFITFSIITFFIIFFVTFRYARKNFYLQILLGLILGGAAGNLIDRLRFKYVIDFLDFYILNYHWPAFNVADSAICIGVGFITIALLKDNQN